MIKRNSSKPAGTTLICVLVCLSVSTAIVTTTIRGTLQTRRNERLLRQMRQTEFLLDAGILRAAQKLADSAEYSGEVWRPTAALPGFDDVRVEIEIAKPSDSAAPQRVNVVAKLATGVTAAGITQRSYTFEFKASPTSNEE